MTGPPRTAHCGLQLCLTADETSNIGVNPSIVNLYFVVPLKTPLYLPPFNRVRSNPHPSHCIFIIVAVVITFKVEFLQVLHICSGFIGFFIVSFELRNACQIPANCILYGLRQVRLQKVVRICIHLSPTFIRLSIVCSRLVYRVG